MIDNEELSSNLIFDSYAETYPCEIDLNYTSYLKFLLVRKFCKKSDICLDIGIANGVYSIPLAREVKEIHGVDISDVMLEKCRENIEQFNIPNITICKRSATNLLFDDRMFDLVFSYATLVLVPDIDQALKEIVRVLKIGGIAIIDVHGRYTISHLYWTKYYRAKGHWGIHAFKLGQIKKKFEGLGFEIIEIHPTGILDQWKYIPLLHRAGFLDKVFHCPHRAPDLDYKVSSAFPSIANRWYFVLRLVEKR